MNSSDYKHPRYFWSLLCSSIACPPNRMTLNVSRTPLNILSPLCCQSYLCTALSHRTEVLLKCPGWKNTPVVMK